jgi:hypothetical protein
VDAYQLLLAVVGGAFVALTLGFVWYSPSAFGEPWLELTGKRAEDWRRELRPLLWSVGALVLASVALGLLVELTGAHTVGQGALVGGVAGVLAAAATLSDYLFCGFPLRLCAVQAAFRAIFFVLVGIVLAARS